MSTTVRAADIRVGDTILSESPRYHGPTFTVDAVESIPYIVRPHDGARVRIVGHYVARGTGLATVHPATLSSVPGDKPYLIERAS